MSELEVSKEASAIFRTGPVMKVKDFQNFYLEAMSAGAIEDQTVTIINQPNGMPAFKVDIPCEISYSRTAPVTHRFDTFIDFARNYGGATVFLLGALFYIAIVFIMYA